MSELTINYFSFLKHIPMLPHFFDWLIKIKIRLSGKKTLDYIDQIERKVLTWQQTTASSHKSGGVQFNVDGKEIGHIHSNGLLDVFLKLNVAEQLIREGRVTEHRTIKNSGWLSFQIKTEQDILFAIELLEYSYLFKM
ncbi:MAG: luciferase family protein [Bacteroidota bacterium]